MKSMFFPFDTKFTRSRKSGGGCRAQGNPLEIGEFPLEIAVFFGNLPKECRINLWKMIEISARKSRNVPKRKKAGISLFFARLL